MVIFLKRLFMRTNLLFCLALLAGTARAQNQRPVTELFPLKWKTQIGVTTYRTNMRLHNGLLYIGSNGVSRFELNDPLDGVYALDPKNGEVKATFKVPFAGDDDVTGITIADDKLFFGTDNFYFFCFELETGEEVWKRPLPYDVESVPVNEDFNGDGIMDVAFSVEGYGFYALSGRDGSEIWTKETITSNNGNVAALLVDVNGDGVKDVVTAGRGSGSGEDIDGFPIGHYGDYHFALNGQTGELLWIVPASGGVHNSPFLFQTQGELRIALLDTYGELQIVDLQGNIQSHASVGYWFNSPVMTKGGYFVVGPLCIDFSASRLVTTENDPVPHPADDTPFHSVELPDNHIISATTMIADVLGNRTMQGIGVTEQGTLFLMKTNGETIEQLKLPGTGAEASPFIADVDGDGKLEILIADLDGYLYCFGTNSKGKVEVGAFR